MTATTTIPIADIRIPGYRIVRELGRGGMAAVFLAIQESMDREVAIKVMLPQLSTADPSFGERFLREARIVAKLSHPNIIAVYDVGVAGPYQYFSMEYHTGGDLRARIHQGMMPKMALAITREVANALAFAHAKGYVHRDVKPENVMFRHDGTALLTDFGIAKAADAVTRMTATGAVIGTPYYMSPEQAQGSDIDQRADLYSLGVMVYEMLTGNVPYTGSSALSIGIKHLKEPIPTLPPPYHVYQPLLERLLAKNPAERFQNGQEVMAAIDAMATGTQNTIAVTPTVITGDNRTAQATVVTTKPDASSETPKPTREGRRMGLMVMIAIVVPALATTGYFLLRPTPPTPTATTESSVLSTGQTDRVALLLAEAGVAAVAGRYLEPRNEGAVHKYHQVLALDPGNTRAQAALQEIAKQFITQTDRALDKKDYNQAAAALQQAEETDPSNPLLAARRQAIREARAEPTEAPAVTKPTTKKATPHAPKPATVTALAPAPVITVAPQVNEAQEREQKLTSIFTRMQELLSPGGLTSTRAALATELYNEATKIAPSDARVRNAPGQIADAYLRLATARADAKDYPEANDLIRRGLDIAPNHRLLTGLQKDIVERQKTKPRTFGTF